MPIRTFQNKKQPKQQFQGHSSWARLNIASKNAYNDEANVNPRAVHQSNQSQRTSDNSEHAETDSKASRMLLPTTLLPPDILAFFRTEAWEVAVLIANTARPKKFATPVFSSFLKNKFLQYFSGKTKRQRLNRIKAFTRNFWHTFEGNDKHGPLPTNIHNPCTSCFLHQ